MKKLLDRAAALGVIELYEPQEVAQKNLERVRAAKLLEALKKPA